MRASIVLLSLLTGCASAPGWWSPAPQPVERSSNVAASPAPSNERELRRLRAENQRLHEQNDKLLQQLAESRRRAAQLAETVDALKAIEAPQTRR